MIYFFLLFFASGFNSALSLQRVSFSSADNGGRPLPLLIAGRTLDTVRASWLLEFDCTESTCASKFEIARTTEASLVLVKLA